jgi:WD40 repeat protein
MLAVASGPNTRKLFVWQWQVAKEPREFAEVANRLGYSLAFSPDAKYLAVCGDYANAVRVWDVASGRLAQTLVPPETNRYWSRRVAFSPDGKTLIASIHNNTTSAIHLWDTASWKQRCRFEGGASFLSVSSDSRLLADGDDGLVRVRDLATGNELAANNEAHRGWISELATAGSLVATAGSDQTFRVWDMATGKQRLNLEHEREFVGGIALSPDGAKLISIASDDTVRLWDVAGGRLICKLPGHGKTGSPGAAVGFTRDGKHFVSWGYDQHLRKWDVATGKALLEHTLKPKGVAVPSEDAEDFSQRLGPCRFSPDGNLFAQAVGNELHVFDVATGKDLHQIAIGGDYVVFIAFAPDSKALLASVALSVRTTLPGGGFRVAHKNYAVNLWELSTGKMRKQFILPGYAGPVAFSPDGRHIATTTHEGDRGGGLQVRDLANGQDVIVIQAFRGHVRSLAFSGDGNRLISGMADTTALIWDLAAFKK